MNGTTLILQDPAAVALDAAERLLALIAAKPEGNFSLGLSGGSTPQRLFKLLAEEPWRGQIPWQRIHVFFADERFLPHDHPDSNYYSAEQLLLAHVPIPAENLHPMPTDTTAEDGASRYEAELKAYFGDAKPRFDLILLGMGPDGHTASLFPGQSHPFGPWVLPVHNSPKPPPTRLTLSLEIINLAHNVLFLVTGTDKAEAIGQIRDSSKPPLPAGQIKLEAGDLVWLLDEAAGL